MKIKALIAENASFVVSLGLLFVRAFACWWLLPHATRVLPAISRLGFVDGSIWEWAAFWVVLGIAIETVKDLWVKA